MRLTSCLHKGECGIPGSHATTTGSFVCKDSALQPRIIGTLNQHVGQRISGRSVAKRPAPNGGKTPVPTGGPEGDTACPTLAMQAIFRGRPWPIPPRRARQLPSANWVFGRAFSSDPAAPRSKGGAAHLAALVDMTQDNLCGNCSAHLDSLSRANRPDHFSLAKKRTPPYWRITCKANQVTANGKLVYSPVSFELIEWSIENIAR